MLLLIGVLLYAEQSKANVLWFRLLCGAEFAAVVLAFALLIKKQTKRDANLFNFSWMAASTVTQLLHGFFLMR